MQSINSIITSDQIKTKKSFKMFNKQIRSCQNQNYEFKSDDFCLNGRICRLVHRFRYRKITEEYECKCPIKQRFKCGKYCAKDSISCDYFKLNEKRHYFANIKDCGNHFF
jgi:hypothetical protein